ncbi:MAG: DegT/DnrJ/EryC1/StrS family aminotransferase [Bacteroidetes bacterium]|nr:DegT/DnrJ/EryC1/StrS family aminotransferase [Bacteroidota bacterium]
MANKKFSRREFIMQNSIAGAGVILASGAAPTVFSGLSKNASMPAILGGAPAANINWPKWPMWNPDTDEKLLLESIRSGVWSRSKIVDRFESEWAKAIGSKRCLTVVNGTNSLIVSMIQLGIGAGDEVLIPPYTFIASPQAVLATGAIPVFVDTDIATMQMDATKIEAKITPRTKAIMPVHLAGNSCDMNRIMEIARKHNLVVVEDACQAHLAEYNNKKLGTFGHAGCFSFQNSKNLPIGEGGAIMSDDGNFIDRCHSYHNLGFPYGTTIGSFNSGSVLNGNKLRLTEYQAAIGLAQLKRLDSQTTARYTNAEYLTSRLKKIPGILPMEKYPETTKVAYHLYVFRYKKEEFKGLSRDAFMNALDAEGVSCYGGYTPLNKMPFLADAFKSKNFVKTYSKKKLNYDKYMEQNQCPQNDILCNEEAVWFNQRFFLTGEPEMNAIYNAIEKIHTNAEAIKNASKK